MTITDHNKALSIYIKHDYIMSYDEMFERAECCGILPVRVNSHHNKLHLISNKFSRVSTTVLNKEALSWNI